EQVEAVVRVVQAVGPDVLVLADIDYDLNGAALTALADRIGGYPHRFAARPNRGLASGRDLDGDGRLGGAGDAEGYGDFNGQGGMAILSRWPLDADSVRDFSAFRWTDLPDARMPGDDRNPSRLSTTVHWDVPVLLDGGRRLHLLTWHATAPVFDGPEDRNGWRNHDETAFWLAYLGGDLAFAPPEDFVVLGVANADPNDGESRPQALAALLARLHDTRPESAGGRRAADMDGGVNLRHNGPPELDTVDWEDGPRRPGNLRVDYVLPAPHLQVVGSGVFWPPPDALFGRDARLASRHRLVWVDLEMP
ncbi:MAG: endonuclease/exonuclease/phosphatase family protein, partial [Alphaproteobacteria bacterium]|nr:endonuclease/exonuclease/phosphatase family protein [Alphaproteobacteria bacterium]